MFAKLKNLNFHAWMVIIVGIVFAVVDALNYAGFSVHIPAIIQGLLIPYAAAAHPTQQASDTRS